MCQFRTLGGGPAYGRRQELANAGDGNVAPARGRLRHQRRVANLAVEHEPLRVQGALRLLHEKPRGLRRDGDEDRRRHGAGPELVRSAGDGQPGPDPRALTQARFGHAGTALTIQGAVWLRPACPAAPEPAAIRGLRLLRPLARRMPRVSGMTNIRLARASRSGAAGVMIISLGARGALAADPPTDRVLQADRYTSEKGRGLAQKYQATLRDLNAKVYHCMPWLEVKKEGVGFYKPKHVDGDSRYLSLNVTVDQQPSPEFGRLTAQERVSAMFSRYVPHLLRSMATSDLLKEPGVDGFTVIVSYLKDEPASAQPPVHETAAAFVPKSLTSDFVKGKASVAQLAEGSHVIAWDGETKSGQLKPKGWADDFVLTYKVAGYSPDPKAACN